MRVFAFCFLPFFLLLNAPSVRAAEFVAEQTWSHGLWSAHLFRNLNGNRLFCAVEVENGGTFFRINRYRDSGETFLEIFNPEWSYLEGNVRFSISFLVGMETYEVDFAGKSWGDSYTHDFQQAKSYEAVLDIVAASTTFNIRNSNGTSIAQFAGGGSREAVGAYRSCVGVQE